MTGSSADYDVVIVGAGIAGCAAAALYGRRGARVALIERHADPAAHKIACTTFIQASATPVLERLGMVARLTAAGAIPNAADIWTRWELIAGASPSALCMDRGRVTGVVVRSREGGEHELSARLVVGADGRTSRAAALSGVKARTKHARYRQWL
jgi:2-polyprenyl-6-methoxyphenol hydroxylase-like FAD-dependent oxidoreductase